MTAVERVAIRRTHRLHPDYTAERVRDYIAAGWSLQVARATIADRSIGEIQAVMDEMDNPSGKLL